MDDKFTWKAEIKFVGTADEFNKLGEALDQFHLEFEVAEWRLHPFPGHVAGCWPMPLDNLLGAERVKKLVAGMPQAKLRFIDDICGGIRTAHLHLGDQVVLLSRALFKTLVADVAHELGEMRVESCGDYIDVVQAVGHLAPGAVMGDPSPHPN